MQLESLTDLLNMQIDKKCANDRLKVEMAEKEGRL
jgi:hypothetical protein